MVKMHPDVWLVTVEHILIEYGNSAEVRQRYHDAENLQQSFQETSVTYVFDFLCEIQLYYIIIIGSVCSW